MVVGDGEKYAAAIVCPAFYFLHGWCAKHGVKFQDNRELIQYPKVIQRFQKEIDKINESFGSHRQLKKFELVLPGMDS